MGKRERLAIRGLADEDDEDSADEGTDEQGKRQFKASERGGLVVFRVSHKAGCRGNSSPRCVLCSWG